MALPTNVERNIEKLNYFEKFDYFINSFSLYHMNRCRNGEDCSKNFETVSSC